VLFQTELSLLSALATIDEKHVSLQKIADLVEHAARWLYLLYWLPVLFIDVPFWRFTHVHIAWFPCAANALSCLFTAVVRPLCMVYKVLRLYKC
jgi:hypothetical protein